MMKEFRIALAWGGSILLLALGAKFALGQGYIDRDTMLRLVIGANGLMIIYYGNLVPKKVAPSANVRQIMRVSGWSQVLSGLFYTGLWAFAPIPVAATLGTAAVAGSLILIFGYCFWMRARVGA